MKKLLIILLFLSFTFILTKPAFALEDPRTVANNKVGIHILFPEELEEASKLVNSNGGNWGYVTIPIQAGERDLIKWQKFMDNASKFHVIPIIRLASEGDYFNTKVWRKPVSTDLLDFANFLNSLDWPTKNRYVLVFNEPNRDDEWGGKADPSDYAQILSYAVSVFKSKNQDFFIISAGLDNAAENSFSSFNQYTFLREMDRAVPGIFYQVDGFGSHSYPNPGFSQPPEIQNQKSIASFRFEKNLIDSLGSRNQPIFITETGWSKNSVNEDLFLDYYKKAFSDVWSDPNITAVTPFLLRANAGPFVFFSFIDGERKTKAFEALESLSKNKGNPTLVKKVLGQKIPNTESFEQKDFSKFQMDAKDPFSFSKDVRNFFKWLLNI